MDGDRAAGKRTLAVRLGRRGARLEYRGLLLGAFGLLPVYAASGLASAGVLAPLVLLPWARRLDAVVARCEDGPALNEALAGTARLGLAFSLLFCLGWLWR